MLNPNSIRYSGDINESALSYWRAKSYTGSDLIDVGESINTTNMAAVVTFHGEGKLQISLSQRTWDRQEGHFPAMTDYFEMLARHPSLYNRTGKIFLWLEDGVWEHQQEVSRRAPTLCFGRHVNDTHSLLMPDPAYTYSIGYAEENTEIRKIESTIGFENKIKTMFFRGAASGIGIETPNWVNTARGRICLLSNQLNRPEMLDAKITRYSHLAIEQQSVMRDAGVVGEVVPFNQFLRYLYLISADGYCCAWKSFPNKLASSSVAVKITGEYEQWFYRDLIAWKHYVPLRADLNDLVSVYEWLQNHQGAVRSIITEANHFVATRLDYGRNFLDMVDLCCSILDCQKPE